MSDFTFPSFQEIHEVVNGNTDYTFWTVDFREGRTVVRATSEEDIHEALQAEYGRVGGPFKIIDPVKAPWANWAAVMETLQFTWFDTSRGRHMGVWWCFPPGYDPPLSVIRKFPKRGWKVGLVWPRVWQMVLPPERGGVNFQYHENRAMYDEILEGLFEAEKRKLDIYKG